MRQAVREREGITVPCRGSTGGPRKAMSKGCWKRLREGERRKMEDKIQTGLRVPEELYNMLRESADRAGISLNSEILFLIDVGMRAVNLGIQEASRDIPRIQKDTDE